MFTPEELAEMAAADAEIEASFQWTSDKLKRSRELDKIANMEAMPPEKRMVAEYQRAYRKANKDKLAERQRVIAKVRKDRGLSQTNLAVLLGVSRSTAAAWEAGGLPAPWDRLSQVFPELGSKEAGSAGVVKGERI